MRFSPQSAACGLLKLKRRPLEKELRTVNKDRVIQTKIVNRYLQSHPMASRLFKQSGMSVGDLIKICHA